MKEQSYAEIREQLSKMNADEASTAVFRFIEEEVGELHAEFMKALIEEPSPRDELISAYAVRGCGAAQVVLGLNLVASDKAPDRASEGVFWLARASAGGNGQADFILGSLYASGRLLEKNIFKAIQHFEKAANLNLPKAQYMLAVFHLDEDENFYDLDKARMWLKRSSGQGNEKADVMLNRLSNA